MEIHSTGEACGDCLMLLANGETPEDWDEVQAAEYLERVGARTGDLDVTIGGPHDDDCPNLDEDGEWMGTTDCSCEDLGFSWSACDVCGSKLGGDRHAVTFFVKQG